MSNERPFWEQFHERMSPDDDLREQASELLRIRRQSVVRVLDAALGVLSSTRSLVEATEALLREQRDRIASDPQETGAECSDEKERRHIDLSY